MGLYSLKAENFSSRSQKGKSKVQSEKGSKHCFELRGRQVAKNKSYFQQLRAVPGEQPARKQTPQSYNHKELNSAKNKKLGSRFFCKPLDEYSVWPIL